MLFIKLRKNVLLGVAVVGLGSLLSACAQTGEPNKQDAGMVLGAVAGGLIGSQFGAGGGAVAATIAGATAGALIGGAIGAAMDEEDRREMERLTIVAFDTNEAQDYVSPRSGAKVNVKVVKTTRTAGKVCRTASQTVELSDGARSSENVTACKGSSGGWVV